MNKIICALGATFLLSVSGTSLSAVEMVAKPVFKANQALTMQKVFEQALERFPMRRRLAALEQEAQALKERGGSLIAAAPSLSLRYQDDRAYNNGGLVEYEAGLQLPIWRWGQRSAGKNLGQVATERTASYGEQLQYEVAERLRAVIWNLRLKQNNVIL